MRRSFGLPSGGLLHLARQTHQLQYSTAAIHQQHKHRRELQCFVRTPPGISSCEGDPPFKLRGDLKGLSFRNLPSSHCATIDADGQINVIVDAQGGRWSGNNRPDEVKGAALVNYSAWLRTRPERLEEDLASLRLVLGNTKIKPPVLEW
jgi:hypothetical protein